MSPRARANSLPCTRNDQRRGFVQTRSIIQRPHFQLHGKIPFKQWVAPLPPSLSLSGRRWTKLPRNQKAIQKRDEMSHARAQKRTEREEAGKKNAANRTRDSTVAAPDLSVLRYTVSLSLSLAHLYFSFFLQLSRSSFSASCTLVLFLVFLGAGSYFLIQRERLALFFFSSLISVFVPLR